MTEGTNDDPPDWDYIADWYSAMLQVEIDGMRRARRGRSGPWPWSKKVPDRERAIKRAVLVARSRMTLELSVLERILDRHSVDRDWEKG
jgi:hypothetical protein